MFSTPALALSLTLLGAAPDGAPLLRLWSSPAEVTGVAVCADGTAYASGTYKGRIDLDPTQGTDLRDGPFGAFLVAIGADGSYRWGRTWSSKDEGTSAQKVACTSAGPVVVLEDPRGPIDLDPTDGADVRGASENVAAVVALRPDGAYRWGWTHEGHNVSAFAALEDGSVVLGGTLPSSNPHHSPAFLTRLDGAGKVVWTKTFGAANARVSVSINAVTASSNRIFAGGTAAGDVGVGDAPAEKFEHLAGFVICLNLDGSILWSSSFRGGVALVDTLAVHPDGVVAGGSWRNTVDFDPGPATLARRSSDADYDAFTTLLDGKSGQLRWLHTFGGAGPDLVQAVAVDGAGTVRAFASRYAELDVDPDPARELKPAGRTFLLDLAANGAVCGATTIAVDDHDGSYAPCTVRGAAATPDGRLWAGGHCSWPVKLGTSTLPRSGGGFLLAPAARSTCSAR